MQSFNASRGGWIDKYFHPWVFFVCGWDVDGDGPEALVVDGEHLGNAVEPVLERGQHVIDIAAIVWGVEVYHQGDVASVGHGCLLGIEDIECGCPAGEHEFVFGWHPLCPVCP